MVKNAGEEEEEEEEEEILDPLNIRNMIATVLKKNQKCIQNRISHGTRKTTQKAKFCRTPSFHKEKMVVAGIWNLNLLNLY